jgi:caffeoyl-CoA O-methyltransferase
MIRYPEHAIADQRARPILDRLREEDQAQRDAGLSVEERTRNVTAPTGKFLFSLVRSIEPEVILEIGSSNGYSTIWLALAAREYGGQVIGSEISPERAADANANLAMAGLDGVADVRTGDGSEIATSLRSVDMVFLDAEKDDYPRHFENVVGLVRHGGLILTDNVTSHDCSALLEMIQGRIDVVTQTIPFERGLEYTVKF